MVAESSMRTKKINTVLGKNCRDDDFRKSYQFDCENVEELANYIFLTDAAPSFNK